MYVYLLFRGIRSLEVLDKEIQKAKYLKQFPKVQEIC